MAWTRWHAEFWHDTTGNLLTLWILTRHDTQHLEHVTCQTSMTKFLNIFRTHVPTSWGHVKKSGTKFLKIFCTHVPTSWKHVKDICPSSAKSICYFSVCHWVVSQGSGCSSHSAYLSIQEEQGRGGGKNPDMKWHGIFMTRHDTQTYGITRENMAWHGTWSHDVAWHGTGPPCILKKLPMLESMLGDWKLF